MKETKDVIGLPRCLKVADSCQQSSRVMPKVANGDVAVVAKQAANFPGLRAMVHRKVASWLTAADCAQAFLLNQHLFILLKRYSETVFELGIPIAPPARAIAPLTLPLMIFRGLSHCFNSLAVSFLISLTRRFVLFGVSCSPRFLPRIKPRLVPLVVGLHVSDVTIP